MSYIRLAYRSVFVIVIVLIGLLLTPFVQSSTMKRKGISADTTSAWHRWLSRALGIRMSVHGKPVDEAALYVCNHISWFDICALGGDRPLRFLSKSEVKDWPIIGWLATKAGTLYIKRGAHGSRDALETMSSALQADQNVCLFPEGTTTDGNTRKFHGRLIQSAINANTPVQPVALFYPPAKTHGAARAHPDILYVDDTSLAESVLMVLKSPRLRGEIHYLAPVSTSDKSRDEITRECEKAISNKLDELLTDSAS